MASIPSLFPRTLVILLFAGVFLVPSVGAHGGTETPDGRVKISWGFLNEPAVTWTKTGLDLRLTDVATGEPITGAETTLVAELHFQGEDHHFQDFRAQHGKPGAYTGVITFTEPGTYILHLRGTLLGSPIDMEIPAQAPVLAIEDTMFPPKEGMTPPELLARIAALEAQLENMESEAMEAASAPMEGRTVPSLGVAAVIACLGVALLVRAHRRA